jgi:pimeloyl-ACP methyl ester carboxylesterase
MLVSIIATALLMNPSPGWSEEVQFDTADKVELHGTFFPSSKAKAPCVILLHGLKGNRDQNGWKELAQVLSKDFAVLSFDFRGHGDSTNVDSMFWNGSNNMIKGAARKPNKITHKDFPPNYLPVLANDVTAAKRYLDRQNDAGACNSSNVIIIGAEEGAAIGALWMYAEWLHPRMIKNMFGGLTPDPTGKVEGEDIAAAIWLSIPKTLGGADVGYYLRGPNNKIRDKVPMVFFYGDKDQKANAAANALLAELKRSGKEKLEFTRTRAKNTNLSGAALLGKKSLGTEEEISTYLVDNVMPKRGAKAWVQRDPEKGPPLTLLQLYKLGFPNLR